MQKSVHVTRMVHVACMLARRVECMFTCMHVTGMLPMLDHLPLAGSFSNLLSSFYQEKKFNFEHSERSISIDNLKCEENVRLFNPVKVHFSMREKIMRIGQNGPLEKFMRFYLFQHYMHYKHMA